jgi:hypothetical protein
MLCFRVSFILAFVKDFVKEFRPTGQGPSHVEGEVKMNGVIDLHDEQVAQAQQSINDKGKYTVLSKTFLPPNQFWSFKPFPAKATHVDIAGDPNALPARRKEDTARRTITAT